MTSTPSQAEINRKQGKFQLDEQHERIVDAAEQLFLEKGIESVSMSDIAAQAGITRVTVYRYFANRDEIALKVQQRMFAKINSLFRSEDGAHSLESHRRRAQLVIRNFAQVKDAFRFIGMFDAVYLENAAGSQSSQAFAAQLRSRSADAPSDRSQDFQRAPCHEEITVMIHNIIWFLEKLALRGELTWGSPEVAQEQHLRIFEDIILGYLDRLAAAPDGERPPDPG